MFEWRLLLIPPYVTAHELLSGYHHFYSWFCKSQRLVSTHGLPKKYGLEFQEIFSVWRIRSETLKALLSLGLQSRQGGKCRQLAPSLGTGVPTCPTQTKSSYRILPKQLTITFHSQPNVSFSQSLEISWDDERNAGTKASIAIRPLDLVFLSLLPSYTKDVPKQIFQLGQEWGVVWGLQASFTKQLHIGTEAPKKFTWNTINLF